MKQLIQTCADLSITQNCLLEAGVWRRYSTDFNTRPRHRDTKWKNLGMGKAEDSIAQAGERKWFAQMDSVRTLSPGSQVPGKHTSTHSCHLSSMVSQVQPGQVLVFSSKSGCKIFWRVRKYQGSNTSGRITVLNSPIQGKSGKFPQKNQTLFVEQSSWKRKN